MSWIDSKFQFFILCIFPTYNLKYQQKWIPSYEIVSVVKMFPWKCCLWSRHNDMIEWQKGWLHSLHTDSHKRDVKSISLENNCILCRKSFSFYTKAEKKVACNNKIYHLNTILPTALTLKRAIHSECPFLKNGNERSEWKWKNMNVKIVSKNNVMLCNLPQFYDLK